MGQRIVKILTRKRSAKDWCAITVLAVAAALEFADAAFGLNGIATEKNLATSDVIDVADIVVGAAAALVLRA